MQRLVSGLEKGSDLSGLIGVNIEVGMGLLFASWHLLPCLASCTLKSEYLHTIRSIGERSL